MAPSDDGAGSDSMTSSSAYPLIIALYIHPMDGGRSSHAPSSTFSIHFGYELSRRAAAAPPEGAQLLLESLFAQLSSLPFSTSCRR